MIKINELKEFNGLVYLGGKKAARADFAKNGGDSEMLFCLHQIDVSDDDVVSFVKKDGFLDPSVNAWEWIYRFENSQGVIEVSILDLPHEQKRIEFLDELIEKDCAQ